METMSATNGSTGAAPPRPPGALDVDLVGLRALVAIADTGSFSAAAARTARTQSAVSLQIRRLEERLGVRLLERTSRSVRATRAGDPLNLSPLDALHVYALKTAPAFEAALLAGLRLAGDVPATTREAVSTFARQAGVGFQIRNDLADWRGDEDNKLESGGDAAALRPTVLLALALQKATEQERFAVGEWLRGTDAPALNVGRLRRLLERHGVFGTAETLIDRCRERAEAVAEAVDPPELRSLLLFLSDTLLADDAPVPVNTGTLTSLPIVS